MEKRKRRYMLTQISSLFYAHREKQIDPGKVKKEKIHGRKQEGRSKANPGKQEKEKIHCQRSEDRNKIDPGKEKIEEIHGNTSIVLQITVPVNIL